MELVGLNRVASLDVFSFYRLLISDFGIRSKDGLVAYRPSHRLLRKVQMGNIVCNCQDKIRSRVVNRGASAS